MTSGGKWFGVIAAAALLAVTACSSGDDNGATESLPVERTVSAAGETPPPPPAREDGRMPDEAFARFTTMDADVAAGIPQWSADATECTNLGKGGDLEGFRDCIGDVWAQADEALSKAGSNAAAESGEIAAECLEATTAYAAAISNLRTATALARGFADSLDVKSMPAALQTLAKGRKAYTTAGAQVRAACKPS